MRTRMTISRRPTPRAEQRLRFTCLFMAAATTILVGFTFALGAAGTLSEPAMYALLATPLAYIVVAIVSVPLPRPGLATSAVLYGACGAIALATVALEAVAFGAVSMPGVF